MRILTLALSLLLLCSCGGNTKRDKQSHIFTSIAPLAYIVEQIVDTTAQVGIIVPQTTSPETYEPTTLQIKQLTDAELYFHTGLIDFEVEVSRSVGGLSKSLTMVDLSQGVDVVAGSCSHGAHDSAEEADHGHGIDPHTWLSPVLMRDFAQRITQSLIDKYPENEEIYRANSVKLLAKIDTLDSYIRSKNIEKFVIAHPSLTYYARDYGAEQIAIEVEGKDPSLAQMKEIVDRLKAEKITKIIYNSQLSPATAQAISEQTGAQIIDFDPLAHNWLENMYYITNQVAR